MSEFSLSNGNTVSLLVSDLMFLLSFIVSHPLYFLYFVFFSPYIFKLLSFLSPLFLTTFLLLLALLHKCGAVLDKLRPAAPDAQTEDSRSFEELEAYRIVFEAVPFEVGDEEESEEKHCLPDFEKVAEEEEEDEEEVVEYVEIMQKSQDEKKVKAVGDGGAESEKVVVGEQEKESEAMGSKIGEIPLRVGTDNGGDCISKGDGRSVVKNGEGDCDYYYSPPRKEMEGSQNLVSFGSMRKEKEWRRTLACKLFEERHNGDGGEGMDSLWETYEADSTKKISKKKEEEEEEAEEEEEEEEGMDRQLCCLQALKFSAGKMNLGIGRPNLVRISKAFKGFGWLHQQVSKHGRKAHRRD